ncbi:MAG: DEAD/DEAH box helicase [Deltaproteobacteria bacterium]|nr:DEAD/DEAH box helicase [Deltaproteobacteria bacterium]
MSNQNESLSATTTSLSEPLKTFADFKLKPEISKSLEKMGFKTPTPVQSHCFECAMSGVDAVVMAQTGTGKTAAFGIPTVERLDASKKMVQALILVPTRELALQVSKEISAIGKDLGSKCIPVYGGTSFSNQVKEYKDGAQIIVGTPGRVLDHIKRRTIDFRNLNTVILDEADEMLSMGFERELQDIMDALPDERQTLLFSATIPDDIRRLAGRYMSDFITISVSGDAVGATEVSHYVYLVSGAGRVGDLVRVLDEEQPQSAIIFCNTKDETQFVCNSLCDNGYYARAISSDLSQAEREKVLGQIRENKIQFLVATDVAARGIDISHLSHVINFSFPESLEKYIHRTGRTGRQGKHGAAISLITPHDIGNLYMLRLTYKIFPIEKKLPDVANKTLHDELAMLEYFRKSVKGTEVASKYFNLATRMIHSADAQYLLAVLLQQLFDSGKIQTTITMSASDDAGAAKRGNGETSVASKVMSPPPPAAPAKPAHDKVIAPPSPSTVSDAPQNASTQPKPEQRPAPSAVTPGASLPPKPTTNVSLEKPAEKPAPTTVAPRPSSTPHSGKLPSVQPMAMPTPGPWGSAKKTASAPPAPPTSVVKPFKIPSTPEIPAPTSGPLPPRSAHTASASNAIKSNIEKHWQALTGAKKDEPVESGAVPIAVSIPQERVDAAPVAQVPAVTPVSLEKSEDEIMGRRGSIIPDFTDTSASTDIYLDAGRSDGLKISTFMKEIVEKSGLQRTDIGKVRMLTRSTFINVPNVNCEAVFNVLAAMEVDGRKLKVEYTEET